MTFFLTGQLKLGSMDPRLSRLIDDYTAVTGRAVAVLVEGLGLDGPESIRSWRANQIPQSGKLPNGTRYFLHGIGCLVKLPTGTVNFDVPPGGEPDAFNLGWLQDHRERTSDDYGIRSCNELGRLFDAAVASAEFVEVDYYLYVVKRRHVFARVWSVICAATHQLTASSSNT